LIQQFQVAVIGIQPCRYIQSAIEGHKIMGDVRVGKMGIAHLGHLC
jgi:hypothetical protein